MTAKECLSIYTSFFKIGAITFGGGYSMLPILEHEVDTKRGWVSKQELLDYFAIGQTLPGIIAVNVATFVGSKKGGFLGALSAVLGVITPSIIIISLIAAFISNFTHIAWVQALLFGMNIGVAALLVYSVVTMVQKAVVDWLTILLAVGGFVSVAFFGVHNVILLAVGIAAGLAMKWRPGKKAPAPAEPTQEQLAESTEAEADDPADQIEAAADIAGETAAACQVGGAAGSTDDGEDAK